MQGFKPWTSNALCSLFFACRLLATLSRPLSEPPRAESRVIHHLDERVAQLEANHSIWLARATGATATGSLAGSPSSD